MTIDGTSDPARTSSGGPGRALGQALVDAIITGEATEEAMATVANPAPAGPNTTPLVGGLIDLVVRRRPPTVPAEQVRRVCDALDEFAVALAALDDAAPEWGGQERAAEAADWSGALWADIEAGPAIYNRLRSAMVELHRHRAAAVLNQPPNT